MPAPVGTLWKHVYFFEAIAPGSVQSQGLAAGWTETIYVTNTNNDIEKEINYAKISAWVILRKAILSNAWYIRWVRVSDVTNPRRYKIATMLAVGNGKVAAQVTCAALIQLLAVTPAGVVPPDNATHRRGYLVRGLDGALVSGNVLQTAYGGFSDLFSFAQFMANKTVDPATVIGLGQAIAGPPNTCIPYNDPGQTFQPITGIVTNGRQFNMTAALGAITIANKVQIRGVNNPRGVNGTWSSLAGVGAPPYTLGTARRQIEGDFDNTGRARKVVLFSLPITNQVIIGVRTKKTGRPFRLPVGRRRPR